MGVEFITVGKRSEVMNSILPLLLKEKGVEPVSSLGDDFRRKNLGTCKHTEKTWVSASHGYKDDMSNAQR